MRISIQFSLLTLLLILSARQHAWAQELYSVERNIEKRAEAAAETHHIIFQVMKNNRELYHITREVDYDIPFPDLKTFENGASILVNAFEGTLLFFDQSGRRLRELSLYKDISVDYERSVYSTISRKSLLIAFKWPQMSQIILQEYSDAGQFIRQISINEQHINGLAYSAYLDIIAVSVVKWIEGIAQKSVIFIGEDDQEQFSVNRDFRHGAFVWEKNIFIGYSNRNCFVYDTNKKRLKLSIEPESQKMILSAHFFNEHITVIESRPPELEKGQWFYQDLAISGFNNNGQLLHRKKSALKPFTQFSWIVQDRQLLFKTENNTIPVGN